MMYPFLFGYGSFAIFVLRAVLGVTLAVHGWPKVKDLRKNGEMFQGMGFAPGIFWGTIAALLEFFGGIALALGLFTGILAFLFAAEFVVILFWRLAKGMPFVGGWELDLLIFASVLVLLSYSAGHYALEQMMFWMW